MRTEGILVVVGSGAIGTACAQRLGFGRHVVMADNSPDRLATAVEVLSRAGHSVTPVTVDVTDRNSVAILADTATNTGELDTVVLTAGIAPQQGSSRLIYGVDLYGAALVIDHFFPLARRGTVMTVFSSGGAYSEEFSKDIEWLIATTPTEKLLDLEVIDLESIDTRRSYHLAKRGLQVRVQVEALRWGERGARINTVSPGIIATPMTSSEFQSLDERTGDKVRSLIDQSPAGRIGTPDDIAAAVSFLSSAEASFLTGTDLLVDGGLSKLRQWHVVHD